MTRDAVLLHAELLDRGFTYRAQGRDFWVDPRERLDAGDLARIRANLDGLRSIITGSPMPASPPPLKWFRVKWEGDTCRLKKEEPRE